MTEQEKQKNEETRTFVQEMEVAGNEIVSKVKELIQEGNVRRIIVRRDNGTVLVDIPMTAGVLVGGVFALAAPVMAILTAGAAMFARLKVEVVREVSEEDTDETEESDDPVNRLSK